MASKHLLVGSTILLVVTSVLFARTRGVGTPGEGTFKVNRERSKVVSALFKDLDDNRYQVTFELADGTTINFKGTYSGSGRRLTLSIHHGFGQNDRRISGHGEVRLVDSRGDIESLSASGDIDDDSSFSLSFQGTGRYGHDERDGDQDVHSFSDTVRGNGRVEVGDKKWRLTHLVIHMSRDHELTLEGETPDGANHRWTGTWHGDGPVFDVELRQGAHKLEDVRGQLTLSSSKRSFRKIDVSGQESGRKFHLWFEADG